MQVHLSENARAELNDILSYIAEDSPVAAKNVRAAIERGLNWIGRWPLVSPLVPGRGVRSKLVDKYQYRIYYVVTDDEVLVSNIRSTRQLQPLEKPSS
jgi:plasmid stabilization system protein ParE